MITKQSLESSPSISGSTGNEPVNCTACELDEFLCNLAEGYLPCVSSELCTSSPELAEGYLPTFYSDTSQSAQSKSISIASRSYRQGRQTVHFHGFPSLEISRNSTGVHGAELLTWYLAGFPAKTSALPGMEPESTANGADSGERWPGSLAKYSPDTCSWKTAQLSLLGDSEPSLVTWPRSGLMLDGQCWELPTLERRTDVSESGYWPTPQASDNRDRGNASTPAIARRIEAGKQVMLSMTVSTESGRLNPEWVELLMGWPKGWTRLSPLE